jgi:hypothetical protein
VTDTPRRAPDGRPAATPPPAPGGPGALLRTLRAVGWAFFGVRKRSGYQDDLRKLNILHVVAVGIGAVLLLVVGLVALVHAIA